MVYRNPYAAIGVSLLYLNIQLAQSAVDPEYCIFFIGSAVPPSACYIHLLEVSIPFFDSFQWSRGIKQWYAQPDE